MFSVSYYFKGNFDGVHFNEALLPSEQQLSSCVPLSTDTSASAHPQPLQVANMANNAYCYLCKYDLRMTTLIKGHNLASSNAFHRLTTATLFWSLLKASIFRGWDYSYPALVKAEEWILSSWLASAAEVKNRWLINELLDYHTLTSTCCNIHASICIRALTLLMHRLLQSAQHYTVCGSACTQTVDSTFFTFTCPLFQKSLCIQCF